MKPSTIGIILFLIVLALIMYVPLIVAAIQTRGKNLEPIGSIDEEIEDEYF